MRLTQVIDEIQNKRKNPPHRAVYDIFQVLNNNKQVFMGKIDESDLQVILRDLEILSEASPASYNDKMFQRECEQVMNRLQFFLDRLF